MEDAEKKWKAGKKSLIRWGAAVSLYALAVSILLGYMSEAYRTALKAAGRQIGDIAVTGCIQLLYLAENAAGVSRRILVSILSDISYWIIQIVIVGICILAVLGISFFLFRKMKRTFSFETAWPIFLALGGLEAVTAVSGNVLQKICPINVVYADLLFWLVGITLWGCLQKAGVGTKRM